MARTITANFIRQTDQAPATTGRVFTISFKRIPRVNAQSRARLEAAARAPTNMRRNYPILVDE